MITHRSSRVVSLLVALVVILSSGVASFNQPSAAHAAGGLALERFQGMWNATSNTSGLISQLDLYFRDEGYAIGGQGDPIYPPQYSIVWTSALVESAGVVTLRADGGVGVFYVDGPGVSVPGGRYVPLTRPMTPHLELPGWSPTPAGGTTTSAVAATSASGVTVLPIDRLVQMLGQESSPNPTALIRQLDYFYDNEGGWQSGETSQTPFVVPVGAVFWGDATSAPLDDAQIFPLRTYRGSRTGVFYVYANVQVNSGRYIPTDRMLDLCSDLGLFCAPGTTTSVTTAAPATALPQLQAVMPLEDFIAMYKATPDGDPKPLIQALDKYFDSHTDSLVGGQAATNLEVPVNSVVWTDLQGTVYLKDGTVAPPGKLVPILVVGTYGAYFAYDNVKLSVGGRYAQVSRQLNLENDLKR